MLCDNIAKCYENKSKLDMDKITSLIKQEKEKEYLKLEWQKDTEDNRIAVIFYINCEHLKCLRPCLTHNALKTLLQNQFILLFFSDITFALN
jgi:hypothetical protein